MTSPRLQHTQHMNEEKHTPGPWVAEESEARETLNKVRGADGKLVAIVQPGAIIQVEANARLIAAAPDLLAALIAMRTANGAENFQGWHPAYREAIDMANAAIARASGTLIDNSKR